MSLNVALLTIVTTIAANHAGTTLSCSMQRLLNNFIAKWILVYFIIVLAQDQLGYYEHAFDLLTHSAGTWLLFFAWTKMDAGFALATIMILIAYSIAKSRQVREGALVAFYVVLVCGAVAYTVRQMRDHEHFSLGRFLVGGPCATA